MFEEDFGRGSIAEAASRAIVDKVFHATQFLWGDVCEVSPFGERLSK